MVKFFKYCIQLFKNGKYKDVEVVVMNSTARERREEVCVICEEQKDKGIHLYTSFICTKCEQDIIMTDTNDPRYKYFLNKLRKITAPEIFS
jgi:hypothetical protein